VTRPARPALSLKGRALMLLAQREHSRIELRRKLMPMARAAQSPDADEAVRRLAAEQHVDALLDWLEANQYLSQARFVESRLHARSARYGNRRIEQELSQHGIALDADARRTLRDSEYARAHEVWLRKFGAPAPDAAGRVRQMRFLVNRGFSADVVRRVVRADDLHEA
jgi:regulatory protein